MQATLICIQIHVEKPDWGGWSVGQEWGQRVIGASLYELHLATERGRQPVVQTHASIAHKTLCERF